MVREQYRLNMVSMNVAQHKTTTGLASALLFSAVCVMNEPTSHFQK